MVVNSSPHPVWRQAGSAGQYPTGNTILQQQVTWHCPCSWQVGICQIISHWSLPVITEYSEVTTV